MAIAYRSRATKVVNSTTLKTVLSMPAGLSDGDVIVAAMATVGNGGGNDLVTTQGWTLEQSIGYDTANVLRIYSHQASSEPSTFTLSYSGASALMIDILAYTGANGTIGGSTGDGNHSATALDTASGLVVYANNSRLISLFASSRSVSWSTSLMSAIGTLGIGTTLGLHTDDRSLSVAEAVSSKVSVMTTGTPNAGALVVLSPAARPTIPNSRFLTPVNISPGSTGAWVTADLSSNIPAGATGVMLHVENQSGTTAYNFGARKYIASPVDDRHGNIVANSHFGVAMGVSSDLKLDLYIGNASVVVWLVGFFGAEAVFFDTAVDVTVTQDSTWRDVDITSLVGSNSVSGVFLEGTVAAARGLGVRVNGSVQTDVPTYSTHGYLATGVVSNIFEAQLTNAADKMYLNGYIKTGGAIFALNPSVRDSAIYGHWADNSAPLTSGAVGGIYLVLSAASGSLFGLRAKGTTEDIYRTVYYAGYMFVGCDQGGMVEHETSTANVYVKEIGALFPTVWPASGTVTYAGTQPTVSTIAEVVANVAPGSGAITYAGTQPVVTTQTTVAPTRGTLTYAGSLPVVAAFLFTPVDVAPSYGTVAYAGRQPTVTTFSPVIVDVAPGAGQITIAGSQPSITLYSIVVADIAPSAGSVTYAGTQPSIVAGAAVSISPTAGTVAYAGQAPKIETEIEIQPGAGAVAYAGETPVLLTEITVAPGSGAIAYAGALVGITIPAVIIEIDVTPGAGAVTYSANAPTVLAYCLCDDQEQPHLTTTWTVIDRKKGCSE